MLQYAILKAVSRLTSSRITASLVKPGKLHLHGCWNLDLDTRVTPSARLRSSPKTSNGISVPLFVLHRGWVSLLLLVAAASLAFMALLTVSERFFCPALELISDYLKLPPVVAGATLLSFGNGAPDTFTQMAAVAQVSGWVEGGSMHHLRPLSSSFMNTGNTRL